MDLGSVADRVSELSSCRLLRLGMRESWSEVATCAQGFKAFACNYADQSSAEAGTTLFFAHPPVLQTNASKCTPCRMHPEESLLWEIFGLWGNKHPGYTTTRIYETFLSERKLVSNLECCGRLSLLEPAQQRPADQRKEKALSLRYS